MEITLTLALPRDQLSVPVVRRVLSQSLTTLGLAEDMVSDIELALTEACTNVLDHADGGDEYEVSACINQDACVIEIIDRGAGFDGSIAGEPEDLAEGGRGIEIMRALVDRLEFISRPTEGTVVHLEKRLVWQESAILSRLGRARAEAAAQPR
ncbi:MAG: ATP-binding protein [Mycobacteriales bacterium]